MNVGLLMASSRIVERTFLPYAVILQVTPIVAIAPLIIIWTDDIQVVLLVCAVLVAFFPVLSNTVVGLHSIDPNLSDLFKLYRLSTWQTLFYLSATQRPSVLSGGSADRRWTGSRWRGGRGICGGNRGPRFGSRLQHPRLRF
jgi:NitT/TauT family transport system permease protein